MSLLNPSYAQAREALERYPYFAFAALKALPKAPDAESRKALRRIVAVNVGDPADLREILGINSESLADIYPDGLPPQLSTFDTIDTFLSHFGDNNVSAPAEPVPLAAIDTSTGYIPGDDIPTRPEAPDPHSADSTASAIDAFLKAVPPPQPKRPAKTPPPEESPALTESFARILIKNRNYGKALEIIEELNLKNPEKSIYFADQIRFLRKLIINQSKKGE